MPAAKEELPIAVAVALCSGANQTEANNGGPAMNTVPAIPFKTAEIFINLSNKRVYGYYS